MRFFLDYLAGLKNKSQKDVAFSLKRGYLKTSRELRDIQVLELDGNNRDARSISAHECWKA